jgi:transposase
VRVSTAFNRMLRLPGASVVGVEFGQEGVVVRVRLRRRRRVCSGCGQVGRLAIHDRRVKRWRHLDLGAQRCIIECELRRLWRHACGGPRLEPVPWARPGAGYTRDFEDVVAFLAQQMAKTPIARLLRVAWDTVGQIVERVVADHLDERRLQGLVAIGCDEISCRKGQRYLTCVADHARGAIIWARPGRNAATLQAFFDELGERKHSIRAVSIDMSPLPRLPAQGRAPRALPPRRPVGRRRASQGVALVGVTQPAQAVRQARTHDPPLPRRHPRRDPPRALQRPPRGTELQGPPDQPPQLRLPRPRPPHRPHPPLRRRHRHRPAVHHQLVRRT